MDLKDINLKKVCQLVATAVVHSCKLWLLALGGVCLVQYVNQLIPGKDLTLLAVGLIIVHGSYTIEGAKKIGEQIKTKD